MIEPRLPWNGREGFVYGSVIALITCIFMMSFGICTKNNCLDLGLVARSMIALPFVWIAAMLLINLFVGRVTNKVVPKFTNPTDSFYTIITMNIIVTVLMMSMLMTLIGPAIGHIFQGESILLAIQDWPAAWPRNFCAAFWCEMLLAQPIARALMKYIHTHWVSVQQTEKI